MPYKPPVPVGKADPLADMDAFFAQSLAAAERNDCVVTALCHATGADYPAMLARCTALGRKPNRGVNMDLAFTNKALAPWGLKAQPKPLASYAPGLAERGRVPTMRAMPNLLPFGTFFVFVYGHVAALIDGEVVDWTDGRGHRVTSVFEVTKD